MTHPFTISTADQYMVHVEELEGKVSESITTKYDLKILQTKANSSRPKTPTTQITMGATKAGNRCANKTGFCQ